MMSDFEMTRATPCCGCPASWRNCCRGAGRSQCESAQRHVSGGRVGCVITISERRRPWWLAGRITAFFGSSGNSGKSDADSQEEVGRISKSLGRFADIDLVVDAFEAVGMQRTFLRQARVMMAICPTA